MKVVFLDIDGVLNYYGCKNKINGVYFVSDDKLKLLQRLINATGAKIVLSSTWRSGWFNLDNGEDSINAKDFIALRDKLAEYNLFLLSRTPLSENRYRGTEIDMWLKNWKGEEITSFVILDDGRDMKPYGSRLVQTSWNKGLEEKHVRKAIKMLME